jgi:hypothetical protein
MTGPVGSDFAGTREPIHFCATFGLAGRSAERNEQFAGHACPLVNREAVVAGDTIHDDA